MSRDWIVSATYIDPNSPPALHTAYFDTEEDARECAKEWGESPCYFAVRCFKGV